MSIASYFFVGDEEEAARNDGLADGPPERRAEFYRVMDVNLIPVYASLRADKCPSFKPAALSDDYQQVTLTIPPAFVESLAALREPQLPEIISQWQQSESVPYDNEADLHDLLTAMVRLARVARDNKQNMYLWNCI